MKYFSRSLFAVFVLVFSIFSMAPASAQQTPTGSGLSISPTISQFTINKGSSAQLNIQLKNVTVNDINAQAYINDFISDGTTGNPKIITDPSRTTATSIKKLVVGLKDVPLKVGEQKTVSVQLQIPSNYPPGAYFGILRFRAVPATSNNVAPKSGDVALSASVGTIVLITVPGNLREQVQLNGVHVYNGNNDGSFFTRQPNKVGIEIKNLGNGFAAPFGTIEIHKSFNGKPVYTYQLNNRQPRGVILPGSTRIFIDNIKNVSSPGRYKVIASIGYGSGSQVLSMDKTFWYVPGWLVIIILVILALIVLSALIAYRRYSGNLKRKYKRKE